MTFAFPAYHTENFKPASAGVNLTPLVQRAAGALSWRLVKQARDSMVFTTGTRLLQRCERVTVQLMPDDSIVVTSKCVLPTQCLDWGKNRKNVRAFLALIENQIAQGISSAA